MSKQLRLDIPIDSDGRRILLDGLQHLAIKIWDATLVGSVIPFLRINDFSKDFTCKTERMLLDFARHQNQIRALKLLDEKESFHNENVKLIKQMRNAILTWYIKA